LADAHSESLRTVSTDFYLLPRSKVYSIDVENDVAINYITKATFLDLNVDTSNLNASVPKAFGKGT
jgi:hypothetical protein